MSLSFTIITCTYNSERYLSQTIASVLAQKNADVEYIFVDGGSTDRTFDIIRTSGVNYKLVEGVNTGISAAMNAGIKHASGDIIAHLHSDDYYLHENVLSQVATLLEEQAAEWMFGRIMVDADGLLIPEGYKVPNYSYKNLLKSNFIPHPATFVRKRMFDKVGYFNETIKYAMDYDLWLRLGRLSVPLAIQDPLTAYRRHPGSLTSANYLASMSDDFRVRRNYTGRSLWALAYHTAHYIVRRYRMKRRIRLSSVH